MTGICTVTVLLIFLTTERGLNMGPFISIVVKLSIYKDGDIRNIRKFEYLYGYFRHLCNAWKYDLTGNLMLFRPVTKVKNINNYKVVFYFKHMGLFMIC